MADQPLLLALDQGTSSSRTALFNTQGVLIASASQGLAIEYPADGWVQQDPNQIWESQLQSMSKLEKKIGSIKPGKQADIITINTQDLNLFPVHNPVETVVFQANSSNVDTVIISGRIKKFGGKLRYKDMKNKKTLLLRSGRRILRGMNIIY